MTFSPLTAETIIETTEEVNQYQDRVCTNDDACNNEVSFKSEEERNVQPQDLPIVNVKANHDHIQQLNEFDSAKAVNRYILQTNDKTSNNNTENDATAPTANNEETAPNDSCPATNSTCATGNSSSSIDVEPSSLAQADKHNSTTHNNNYNASGTTVAQENVDYSIVSATDLCGTSLIQGVENEQTENFVVTSGYIQESRQNP